MPQVWSIQPGEPGMISKILHIITQDTMVMAALTSGALISLRRTLAGRKHRLAAESLIWQAAPVAHRQHAGFNTQRQPPQ